MMSNIQTATRRKIATQLINRDGYNCHYCGCVLENSIAGYNPKGASIDHVIAQDNGGSDNLDNLVLSCRKCNQNKKTKHYQEFRFMKETDLMLVFLMGGAE